MDPNAKNDKALYPLTPEETFNTPEEKAHDEKVTAAYKEAQALAQKVWDRLTDDGELKEPEAESALDTKDNVEGPITQRTGENYPL